MHVLALYTLHKYSASNFVQYYGLKIYGASAIMNMSQGKPNDTLPTEGGEHMKTSRRHRFTGNVAKRRRPPLVVYHR